ncbi:peptide-methionine (S)-S-oxide reductase MsrA [Sansalvadorimonas sp. 2012CJ34-2]|uniref:Peptide methionine sulfoxide reductase MsrA n=1 Tax=Parendozoicomonas callyspongiae TaxID=2942213 RepID=A0ABT0PL72_9GAMM|nr:peptide-methionine (S)-S-oxide reductase MsrA [Sansalvadorimonas sp. 2012CJ34-2]MCL6272118.1 peptide-methionine (S)-S-oxide reductase MsrA [Sansalvadorimonas sp. 2012CJ34-2]
MNRKFLLSAFLLSLAGSINTASADEAVFAGGCFWCTESDFEKLDGVEEAISGYTGGHEKNPTYPRVSAGITGHTEAVKVIYDPKKVSYEQLLYTYWRSIDPTVRNKQFCDIGEQYRTGIFFNGKEQELLAKASLKKLEDQKRFTKIHTEISELGTFYPAEDYHQDYYKKNPIRYSFYRTSCGRDSRLKDVWGKEAGTHQPSNINKKDNA